MKTYHKILSIIILFPLIILNSCEDSIWGCIQGNGRIVKETRYIGDFENIISYGSFQVEVYLGSETGLSITADENLLSYIRTSIQGNTLVLETKSGKCIRSRDPIIVTVDAKTIEKLKLSGSGIILCDDIDNDILDIELPGSGKIECQNMDIDYLRVSVPGSGIIELSGNARTSDYVVSGSGIIRGIDLISHTCYASIPGSGIIYTSVTDELDVSISGSGILYYSGDPSITSNITGSGTIRAFK